MNFDLRIFSYRSTTRAMVKHYLTHANQFQWSLQGFGMLRLNISDAVRLNIWDSRFRVPNVSMMHTHPWNFESLIVAGKLVNRRFYPMLYPTTSGLWMNRAVIKPGPVGGLLQNMSSCCLLPEPPETYAVGNCYTQLADEIHISEPDDGCITLNYRKRVGEDRALVFWPMGTQWVSAEPRVATTKEVSTIVDFALYRFASEDYL